MIDGRIDDSFLTDGITGSVDGSGFTQDAATVISGKLPPLASTTDIVLGPADRPRARRRRAGDLGVL